MVRFPVEDWEDSLGSALRSWTAQDEESAMRWLNQRPAAERAHLVEELFMNGSVQLTPRLASLALSLPDEVVRTEAVRALLAPWNENPEELRRAVTALHLSPRQTNDLLRAAGLAR